MGEVGVGDSEKLPVGEDVGASVGASVGVSVGASVGASVGPAVVGKAVVGACEGVPLSTIVKLTYRQ